MHPKTKYIFIASMDVTPEKEALFSATARRIYSLTGV